MTDANISYLTRDAQSGLPRIEHSSQGAGVLTREDVEEFRAIVRDTCGEELSDQEAWNRATAVAALARMLLGPIPEDPSRSYGV